MKGGTQQIESFVRAGMIGLVLYLFGASIVMYMQVGRLRDALNWVDHTHEVRYALQDTFSLILDAESAERAFALTSNSEFLMTYFGASTRLQDNLKRLQDLVVDNDIQRIRSSELIKLVDTRLEQMRASIDFARKLDITTAPENYRSGMGRETANRIRNVMEQMLDEENELYGARSIEMEDAARITVLAFVALLLLFGVVAGGYFILANRNIAARNAMLAELLEANAKTERADKFKGDVLNYLGASLLDPLTKISGATDLLLYRGDDPLPERDRKTATDIQATTRVLLSMATNFTNIGLMQGGKALPLQEDDLNLIDVLRDAVGAIAKHAARTGITLDRQLQFERVLVRYDKQKLKQILQNLLDNALKNTPAGGHIEIKLTAEDGGALMLTIRDNGAGISRARLEQIMVPFAQIDSVVSRQDGAIGLGLPMAIGFAQAHGGTLRLDSAIGNGTTAVLCIPAARVLRIFGDSEPLPMGNAPAA